MGNEENWTEKDEAEFQAIREKVEGWKAGTVAIPLSEVKDLQKELREMRKRKPRERKAYRREGLVYTTLTDEMRARLSKWVKAEKGRTKAQAIRESLDAFLS